MESKLLKEDEKTRITFEMETDTCVDIMRDGKQIGRIWSQFKDGTTPYPHDKHIETRNSIQICGFDSDKGPWACGPFKNKKDIVLKFRDNSGEYMAQKHKEYEEYCKRFFDGDIKQTGKLRYSQIKVADNRDITQLKNFEDWFNTNGCM